MDVLEIVGETERGRGFVAGLWVEIRIGCTGIDRVVSEAEIGKSVSIVCAYWNVPGHVGHVAVHAGVPAQRKHGRRIAEADHRIACRPRQRKWERSDGTA